MPAALTPRKFILQPACTRGCSLNPRGLPGNTGDLIHQWFEEGCNDAEIHRKAKGYDVAISESAIARHRKNHLVRDYQTEDKEAGEEELDPVTDVELLDLFIAKAARNLKSKTARVSPELAIKAMELKYRLTSGNVFDAFLGEFMQAGGEMAESEEIVMPDGEEEPAEAEPTP